MPSSRLGRVALVTAVALAVPGGAVGGTQLLRASRHAPTSDSIQPDPELTTVALNYGGSITFADGAQATLSPLEHASVRASLQDRAYLHYLQTGDLGGFTPAPIGGFVTVVHGRALTRAPKKAEIPLITDVRNDGSSRITVFGYVPGVTPPKTPSEPASSPGKPHKAPPVVPTGFTTPTSTTVRVPTGPTSTTTTTTTQKTGTATGTATTRPSTSRTTQPPGTTTTRPSTPSTTRPTGTTTTRPTTPSTTQPPVTTTTRPSTPSTTQPTGTTTTRPSTPSTTQPPSTTTTTTTTTTLVTHPKTTSLYIATVTGKLPVIDVRNQEPGDSASETLTLINGTTETLTLTMSASPHASTPTVLLNEMTLTVKSGASTLYTGPLSASGVAFGTLEPKHVLKLKVTLSLSRTAGNDAQGKTAIVDLKWTGTGP